MSRLIKRKRCTGADIARQLAELEDAGRGDTDEAHELRKKLAALASTTPCARPTRPHAMTTAMRPDYLDREGLEAPPYLPLPGNCKTVDRMSRETHDLGVRCMGGRQEPRELST